MFYKVLLLSAFSLLPLISALRLQRDVPSEIKSKYGNFRENCFPKATGHGCTCKVGLNGEETVQFTEDEKCKTPQEIKTAENKKQLNKEFEKKFGSLKENCYPRPKGGCRCAEKDAQGTEVERLYDSEVDCNVSARTRRAATVRDPVREQAQKNYAAVVDELKNKFKGLKEGCYPRPKGCLCVIGKGLEGRDITERRMKDSDCKCEPGDKSPGCPAQGA